MGLIEANKALCAAQSVRFGAVHFSFLSFFPKLVQVHPLVGFGIISSAAMAYCLCLTFIAYKLMRATGVPLQRLFRNQLLRAGQRGFRPQRSYESDLLPARECWGSAKTVVRFSEPSLKCPTDVCWNNLGLSRVEGRCPIGLGTSSLERFLRDSLAAEVQGTFRHP